MLAKKSTTKSKVTKIGVAFLGTTFYDKNLEVTFFHTHHKLLQGNKLFYFEWAGLLHENLKPKICNNASLYVFKNN